jgi:hypothetical protein
LLWSRALKVGKSAGTTNGATNNSVPSRATSGATAGAFSQKQTFRGALDLGAGVVSLPLCSVDWWQQQLLGLKGGAWSLRFSTGRRWPQHGTPRIQHHPLGKASRKLHTSARDRAKKAIGAMLNGPNQKDKPSPKVSIAKQ